MSTTTSPAPSQASQRPPGTLNENQPGARPRARASRVSAKRRRITSKAFDTVAGFERELRAGGARLDHHDLGEPGAALDAVARPALGIAAQVPDQHRADQRATCPRPTRPSPPRAGAAESRPSRPSGCARGRRTMRSLPCARPRRPRAQAELAAQRAPGQRLRVRAHARRRCPRRPAARRAARRADRDRSRDPPPRRSPARARPRRPCCPGRGSARSTATQLARRRARAGRSRARRARRATR